MKRFAQSVASLVLAGLVLYAALRRFDLRQTMTFVLHAHVNLLVLGSALIVCSYLLRAARWRIWERSVSYWDSVQLILIGFMGNNLLPARLGEILRAHCTAAKTCVGRGRTTALASISLERILDGLILSLFGLLVVVLVPVDRRFQWVLFLFSLVFGALTIGVVLGGRIHKRIRSLVSAANRKFPGHVTAYAREKATQFFEGLLSLPTSGSLLRAMAMTLVVWCVEVGWYYCLGLAVWDGMTVKTALLALVVVNLASLVPLTTGGIGTIEAAAPLVLVSSGVPLYPALAMVLLQHAGQYLFTTIAGGTLYLVGGFYKIPLAHPKSAASPRPTAATPPPLLIEETRSILDQLSSSVELKPPARSEIQLSIVIPAYNEQARLPRTVLETIRWCTSRNINFELIIADDGSRDQTLALVRLFEESDARIRALACPHMGKGATIRVGMLNARGGFILFMDADGATPLNEIPKLLDALEKGHDVAIGSRVVQHPGEAEVKTPFYRHFIGRSFAFFVNLLALGGIGDTQCGFKMFRREAAAAIFSRQKTVGFAFDVEILFIARQLSLSVAEIPVNWTAQPGSKVNLVSDSIRMLWDVSRIRWLHRDSPPTSPNCVRQSSIS
jgi:dolichyl-phosphate beta-glucosyltransferase